MDIRYPEYVKKTLDRVENAGFEAYIVGGAVRDALLGNDVNDYDIAASSLPEETATLFFDRHVIKNGLKHGTVTVVSDGHPIEITTYRIDGAYEDSRHPADVEFARCIEEDLARRDFTVNAMAYNEKRGLVDLFGGREDLERRLVRAVGDPQRRFAEDALRILRAFRFASKLDFEIEEKTLSAAEACGDGLINISAERKAAELKGILLGRGVKKALDLMKKANLTRFVFCDAKLDFSRLDVISSLPCDFACRMAFCLAFEKDIAVAGNCVDALRLSNGEAGRIKKIVKMIREPSDFGTDKELRRFMACAGEDLFVLLEIKTALGENTVGIAERAEKILRNGDCLSVRGLAVNGSDILSLGISGKAVGRVLEGLLDAVLEDPSLNRRQTLLNIAEHLAF